MELIEGEIGKVEGVTFHRRTLGKSRLAAMVATMLAGYGMVYGGAPTPKTPRRKTNTHPMITASDAEIRQWNAHVKTRQVRRSVVKPWRYPHREWRTML